MSLLNSLGAETPKDTNLFGCGNTRGCYLMVRQIQQVTPDEPCLHCGKPDWCYRLGELTVCKRDAEPAPGWEATSKHDADGSRYYAPVESKKSVRPPQNAHGTIQLVMAPH